MPVYNLQGGNLHLEFASTEAEEIECLETMTIQITVSIKLLPATSAN